MNNLIKKIKILLEEEMSDRQFKIMFFSSTAFIIFSILFLLYISKLTLNKYKNYCNQPKIIIMDELDNSFYKKIDETKFDVFNIFAPKFVKQLTTFDYKNKEIKIRYVKNNTLKEAFQSYKKFLRDKKWLDNSDLLTGVYTSNVGEYKIKNYQDYSEFYFNVSVNFDSASVSFKESYFIKIKIKEDLPTNENKIAIFVSSIEYLKDPEDYQNYLKIDKK